MINTITDLCAQVLSCFKKETKTYEVPINDLEFGGGNIHRVEFAPPYININLSNISPKVIKQIQKHAPESQCFAVFTLRNKYFVVSWENFTCYTIYVLAKENQVIPFVKDKFFNYER